MEFVDLMTGYLLTGYSDFESAFAASEELYKRGYKVAYLNEASHVREQEVKEYVRNFEGTAGSHQFQNYRFTTEEQAKDKASESLQTALEVFKEKAGRSPRFLMIVSSTKLKPLKLQKQKVKPVAIKA